LDYQKITIQKLFGLAELSNLKGKRILEVGGSGNMAVAKTFALETNEKVFVITPDPEVNFSSILENSNVELIVKPAESSDFLDDTFDIIYGGAILEHIINISAFFRECFRIIKPDGWVLLNGGPCWSGRVGHHLFVKTKNSKFYSFNDNNPIPDYSHLYLKPHELESLLIGKGIPLADSLAIVNQVYFGSTLNRYSLQYIVNCLWESPWARVIIDSWGLPPSKEVLEKINKHKMQVKKIHPIGSENIYIVAQKV
jgi:SAM-dependent methyltransferase